MVYHGYNLAQGLGGTWHDMPKILGHTQLSCYTPFVPGAPLFWAYFGNATKGCFTLDIYNLKKDSFECDVQQPAWTLNTCFIQQAQKGITWKML